MSATWESCDCTIYCIVLYCTVLYLCPIQVQFGSSGNNSFYRVEARLLCYLISLLSDPISFTLQHCCRFSLTQLTDWQTCNPSVSVLQHFPENRWSKTWTRQGPLLFLYRFSWALAIKWVSLFRTCMYLLSSLAIHQFQFCSTVRTSSIKDHVLVSRRVLDPQCVRFWNVRVANATSTFCK